MLQILGLHIACTALEVVSNELLFIFNAQVGVLIGRGGENIKRVQDTTGVKVQIAPEPTPDRPNERSLTINGPHQGSVQQAEVLIFPCGCFRLNILSILFHMQILSNTFLLPHDSILQMDLMSTVEQSLARDQMGGGGGMTGGMGGGGQRPGLGMGGGGLVGAQEVLTVV